MNNVAYIRVESLGSSEHNPFSPEDQAQFMGENAARLIKQEWNKYGPVVMVDVVPKCDKHSQAFTALLAAHEPERTGPDFLDWLADRLVHVYGESENVDFVLCLRRRADKARKAIALAESMNPGKSQAFTDMLAALEDIVDDAKDIITCSVCGERAWACNGRHEITCPIGKIERAIEKARKEIGE